MFPNLKKPQARDEKLAKCDKIFPIERNSEREIKKTDFLLFSPVVLDHVAASGPGKLVDFLFVSFVYKVTVRLV